MVGRGQGIEYCDVPGRVWSINTLREHACFISINCNGYNCNDCSATRSWHCHMSLPIVEYNKVKENVIKWASMNLQSENHDYSSLARLIINGRAEL